MNQVTRKIKTSLFDKEIVVMKASSCTAAEVGSWRYIRRDVYRDNEDTLQDLLLQHGEFEL